ncbi:MAG: hypothetical protein KGL39_19690 [Patescibacteria group bacterium]|nr:hypothetical protein [Patescibacteria group bacterium]
MESNALSTIQQVDQLLPTVDTLKNMKQVADWMVNAKMLPPGYKDGSDLMVIALRGREMGVPMGQAIQGMFPMKGRIGYMGGFLLSRVRQILPYSDIRIKTSTKEICVLECRRDKDSEAVEVEFSMEEVRACHYNQNWDADKKEWKDKQTWKDPKNMLYWRCVSRAVNRLFSDVFGAPVYQYDELADTDVIDIDPKAKAAEGVPYEAGTEKNEAVSCDECKARFINKDVLARHVETSHKKQEPVEAEVIPSDTAGPIVEPPKESEEAPHKDTIDDSKPKMNQQMVDTLIVQLEKDLWGMNCKTKKDVEEVFENFKKTGAPGKALTTGFKLKVKRLQEIVG